MDEIKEEIINILKKETGLKDIILEIPLEEFGDYAFPCFHASKTLKKSPMEIAQELCRKIPLNDNIKRIEVKGPYLNFFINKIKLGKKVLEKIAKEKSKFGSGKTEKKTLMVEYFHANTHKGVHIGHLRNISMAESLCRILEFAGNKVIRVNYQGDIGPHVAKCVWGYLNLKEKEPKENKGEWLGRIYTLASKKAKADTKVEAAINRINNRLYAKDKELMKVWKKTRQYCLNDFDKFYKEFGVKFDRLYFESEVEEIGKKIVKDMLNKGLAEESEGAIIIGLQKYNLGVYVLLTGDGNALYSTKDLGLAELKNKEFKFDASIHVTGAEQKLHFEQLFRTFEIIGSPMAKKSLHIPYGLVMLPEGKMSSREGTMVLFNELRDKVFKAAETATKKRHKNLKKKELEERARKIGNSALKFSMINRENNKDVVFDWNTALDFNGQTGPYVQYTYTRISSILRKNRKQLNTKVDYEMLNDAEQSLIKFLSQFPEVIEDAARQYKPLLLSRYLLDLSQKFNEYYQFNPVLKADTKLRDLRLFLISSVMQTIKNGLTLLGIDTLEEM